MPSVGISKEKIAQIMKVHRLEPINMNHCISLHSNVKVLAAVVHLGEVNLAQAEAGVSESANAIASLLAVPVDMVWPMV